MRATGTITDLNEIMILMIKLLVGESEEGDTVITVCIKMGLNGVMEV